MSQAPDALVLVVEDQPAVRALAVDVLSEAGFRVVEAGDADGALNLLRQRRDIGVVLIDVNLSKFLDGYELALAASHD